MRVTLCHQQVDELIRTSVWTLSAADGLWKSWSLRLPCQVADSSPQLINICILCPLFSAIVVTVNIYLSAVNKGKRSHFFQCHTSTFNIKLSFHWWFKHFNPKNFQSSVMDGWERKRGPWFLPPYPPNSISNVAQEEHTAKHCGPQWARAACFGVSSAGVALFHHTHCTAEQEISLSFTADALWFMQSCRRSHSWL